MKSIAVNCKLYNKNFQIFSRFPAGISREMGYFFPFPTGNSKHRKCTTLVVFCCRIVIIIKFEKPQHYIMQVELNPRESVLRGP